MARAERLPQREAQADASGVTPLAMNGEAGYTREQVRARRAELQNELARILEQRQEVEARLLALNSTRPVADAALAAPALAPRLSHGGLNAPAKKRPAAHGLEGPEAKRRLTLAERERRVNGLWGQCATVLKTITRHRGAGPFSKAVDPVLLRCPVRAAQSHQSGRALLGSRPSSVAPRRRCAALRAAALAARPCAPDVESDAACRALFARIICAMSCMGPPRGVIKGARGTARCRYMTATCCSGHLVPVET